MDEKTKATLKTVYQVLSVPAIAVFLYGAYVVFTYKPAPKPPEPKIEAFRADQKDESKPADPSKPAPPKPKKGDPKVWHIELVWEVSNADEITIDQGIGKVDAKGSRAIDLDKDTKFTLKAKNVTGEITNELEVNLPAPEK